MKEIKFTKENVRLNVQADDWKDAIHQGVALLEHNGLVTDKYASHIIRNIDEYNLILLYLQELLFRMPDRKTEPLVLESVL